MAKLQLPADFSAFLKLLNSAGVEYLLLGGYAVAHYGVPRATGDMDVWIRPAPANAARLVKALADFGFAGDALRPEQYCEPDRIFRMGRPPLRIELLTSVSGLDFVAAYERRETALLDETSVSMIHLADLKLNKRAAGRAKDLEDLKNLPE